MYPSILTFDFDLILGSFLTFLGPNGLFFGLEYGWKTSLGSTYVFGQLSFSMFSLTLTFYFDLILGMFLTFLGPNGLFLGSMWGSKTVLGSTHVVEQLSFSMIP